MKLSDAVAGAIGSVVLSAGVVLAGWILISGGKYAWQHPLFSGAKAPETCEMMTVARKQWAQGQRVSAVQTAFPGEDVKGDLYRDLSKIVKPYMTASR